MLPKVQAISAPFDIQYSSCSDLKPKTFEWTTEDCPIKVFIDRGILSGIPYQKKEGEKKIAWVCESRAIFHVMSCPRDVWEQQFNNICDSYDLLFTSEKSWIGKHPNVRYCPAGSNLPWAKNQQVFFKTKNLSMIASPKTFVYGHNLRHNVARIHKEEMDLFGGAHGSSRIGKTAWDKEEALNDYRFQIVVENDKYETYYTEKLTDCFATGTIPIYWGAPDIGELFNEEGIIQLTPTFNPKDLTVDLYQSKMNAIQDNFERVQKLENADDTLFRLINEN